jgi:hypothetical protein
VSIYIGATSVGCLLSGITMDLWGRRLAVQMAISSVCIGWLLIAISTTYPPMLGGRALCGFGKGFATPALTVSYKHVQPRHVESVKNIHTKIYRLKKNQFSYKTIQLHCIESGVKYTAMCYQHSVYDT